MSRARSGIAAITLMVLAFVTGVFVYPTSAVATAATITWPSVPLPYSVTYAHGDGSLSVLSDDCSYYYNYNGSTAAVVNISADGSTVSTVNKTSNNWKVVPCNMWGESVAGDGNATYFVQDNTTTSKERVVAVRGNSIMWSQEFPTTTCNKPVRVLALRMGFDGTLYADVMYPTSCSTWQANLTGFDTATGKVLFATPLPGSIPATSAVGLETEIMPYDNGIAVVNNGNHVYYYAYGTGVQNTGDTFSPTPPTGSTLAWSTTTAAGRIFLQTTKYNPSNPLTNSEVHIYYKDPADPTIHEITSPSGASLVAGIYAAPAGGVVARFVRTGGAQYFGYFDASGSELYEVNITSDTSAGLVGGTRPQVAVDSEGNVLVVRTMQRNTSPYDQEVYVDSFDTNGVKTRLFDSEAEFGASGADVFTTSNWVSGSVGDGKIYLTLCRQTGLTGLWPTTCASNGNPRVVGIPAPSHFDYPRSAIFTAINSLVQYVALGDSYSSADGNSPFIIPTDNNGGDGCDRSASYAYPELLAADLGFSLRAFVACSGATSDEVYTGKNGEPSQLASLDANTDIVTITSGGNDAGFADFAAECVVGTCDAASSQYQYTIDEIDNYLQDNLELLYDRIRTAAPNATVVVVGYPRVTSGSACSCPSYISSGEQIAINTVVTGLNNKIQAAVANAGSGFQFVDPTMTDSPFEGHELGSANPYFFGLNIAEHRFSFHPNADGQAAYAELIANNI